MEKVYNTMNSSGKFNLIGGIVMAVMGIGTCVFSAFMIVHGAKLLKNKKHVLF